MILKKTETTALVPSQAKKDAAKLEYQPLLPRLREMDVETRLEALQWLTDEQAIAMLHTWKEWARPEQLPPAGDWRYWMIQAGRGFGKTRSGAEWIRDQVENHGRRRIALVGRTAADVRDTMVEGESGLLACFPPWNKPIYEPSKRRVTFSSGAIATTYSGEEPDQLRGPQHDCGWCDELAAWKYADAWDQFLFGLRLGTDPRCVITTTPRPVKLIRELLADPHIVITRGSTFDNRENLAPAFADAILKKYEGTRLGRQEIYAELLNDNPNAMWKRKDIDDRRLHKVPDGVELIRIVVGVDPAVTSKESSDHTGIIVAAEGSDGHYYVLADYTIKDTPKKWCEEAIKAYETWEADRIIGEVNNGGDLIQTVLESIKPDLPYSAVRASRGKVVRAEPISALYEQGKVHHIGSFATLEDQMCDWMPGEDSPDNMDALVWALTELHGDGDVLVA